MVMAGPWSLLMDDRPGTVGAVLLPESKLGRLTTALPPRMSTPEAAEEPVGAVPAPPGPGVGEMPSWALGSEPWPAPDFPAPEFSELIFSVRALPGPAPVRIPEPPPEPPRPGFSPPEGDMANDALPPVPGTPGLGPGSGERTTPELSVFPAAAFGGAKDEPRSPNGLPLAFLPDPERFVAEPAVGGGGITLLASSGPPDALEPRPAFPVRDGAGATTSGAPGEEPEYFLELDPTVAVVFVPETDGGGGTTLESWFGAGWKRPEGDPPWFERALPTDGGGAITLTVPDAADGLRDVAVVVVEETAGGGGTTSCVPKSLPIMLLTNDPLAA
jgi:hypothetical protein